MWGGGRDLFGPDTHLLLNNSVIKIAPLCFILLGVQEQNTKTLIKIYERLAGSSV